MRLVLPALLLLVAACEKPAPPPPTGRPATGTVGGAPTPAALVDRVRVQTDLAALRSAIQIYRGTNNAFPSQSNLDALQTNYRIGVEYDYDATTGVVRSRTWPEL
jgi:hypothetical protein